MDSRLNSKIDCNFKDKQKIPTGSNNIVTHQHQHQHQHDTVTTEFMHLSLGIGL